VFGFLQRKQNVSQPERLGQNRELLPCISHFTARGKKYLTILNSAVLLKIIRNTICCSKKYLGNNKWQIKPSETFTAHFLTFCQAI